MRLRAELRRRKVVRYDRGVPRWGTLAVLPFENTGGADADDYFSDGMRDELAAALARIPGLRVAGRTSSYIYKGRAVPAEEIGRTLAVHALVSGTVRRAANGCASRRSSSERRTAR